MRKIIKETLKDSIRVKRSLLKNKVEKISQIADAFISCLEKGGKVIFFGNGGSASDGQHLTAELIGRFKKDRLPLAAICLNTNTSNLTALGNDYGFDMIFVKQLQALAKPEDIVLALSTSGRSKNIIKALQYAKKIGLKTIGFTGGDGGRIKKICDLCIVVPSDITARIQEAHITIGHIICELVEKHFFYERKDQDQKRTSIAL